MGVRDLITDCCEWAEVSGTYVCIHKSAKQVRLETPMYYVEFPETYP